MSLTDWFGPAVVRAWAELQPLPHDADPQPDEAGDDPIPDEAGITPGEDDPEASEVDIPDLED